MPDIFGELRSLTQETPSQEIFDGIWTLLRKQPVEKLEQEYLPYAMSHLQRWPIGLRKVAHREQIPFFRPGDHDPRLLAMLALIDTLHPTHHTNFGDAEARHFAAHELLENIRVLQIDNPRWTTAGVQALVESQGAANLQVLRLRNAMLHNQFEMLLGAPWMQGIRELEISGWNMDHCNIESLAVLGPSNLEIFRSRDGNISPVDIFKNLSTGKVWERLHTIEVQDNLYIEESHYTPSQLTFDPGKLPAWQTLDLRNITYDRTEDTLRFLESHDTIKLSALSLRDSHAWEHTLLDLLKSRCTANLTSLTISGAAYPPAFDFLGETPHMERLETLDLSSVEFDEDSARMLANNDTLTNLKTLRVRGCSLKSEGLLTLLGGPWSLETFDFGSNTIRRAGWDQMLEALADQEISQVYADATHINDTHVMKLGSLSMVEEFTFLPGDLSIHGLVDLCFSEDLSTTARTNARAHVIAQIPKKLLYKVFRQVQPSNPLTTRSTSTQVQHALLTATDTRASLTTALCTPEYVSILTQKQVKATLKRLKVSGYSKLRKDQAREALRDALATSML